MNENEQAIEITENHAEDAEGRPLSTDAAVPTEAVAEGDEIPIETADLLREHLESTRDVVAPNPLSQAARRLGILCCGVESENDIEEVEVNQTPVPPLVRQNALTQTQVATLLGGDADQGGTDEEPGNETDTTVPSADGSEVSEDFNSEVINEEDQMALARKDALTEEQIRTLLDEGCCRDDSGVHGSSLKESTGTTALRQKDALDRELWTSLREHDEATNRERYCKSDNTIFAPTEYETPIPKVIITAASEDEDPAKPDTKTTSASDPSSASSRLLTHRMATVLDPQDIQRNLQFRRGSANRLAPHKHVHDVYHLNI